jgi:hypothetical protein
MFKKNKGDNNQKGLNPKTPRNFSVEDLFSYARQFAIPGTKVIPLKQGKWQTIGDIRIKLLGTASDFDNSYAHFAIEFTKDTVWVIAHGEIIPGTNIRVDTWYPGDGTDVTILAFESIPQKD